MLAIFFSAKMSVCDPLQPVHDLLKKTNVKFDGIKIIHTDVLKILKQVDP